MTDQTQELRLIGLAVREFVRDRIRALLRDDDAPDGHSLLRLDALDRDVLESCINAVAADPECRPYVDLRIPCALVREECVSDRSVLFPGSAAQARNTPTERRLVLFANDRNTAVADTLRQVAAIDEGSLKQDAAPWIRALPGIFTQFDCGSEVAGQLEVMFAAFCSVMQRNLFSCALYLLETTRFVLAGQPLCDAANEALECLRLPRYRDAMPSTRRLDSPAAWRKTFTDILCIPAEFFETTSRPVATSLRELAENLADIAGDLRPEALETYDSLSKADGRHAWPELLRFDWKRDRLDGFLQKTVSAPSRRTLGAATLEFFEAQCNDRLSDPFCGEYQTLQGFLRAFAEDDRMKKSEDFIPAARLFLKQFENQLAKDRKLRSRWEKLTFPSRLEGEDFLDSLLQAALVLVRQSASRMPDDPVLLITCLTPTDSFFNKVNRHVIDYFALRNAGLETQCGGFIAFRFKSLSFRKTNGLNPLFHQDEVRACPKLPEALRKLRPSDSLARDARSLQFDVCIVERPQLDDSAAISSANRSTVRISWTLPKDGIAFSLARDMRALLARDAGDGSQRNLFRVIAGRNFRQSNAKGLLPALTLANTLSFGLSRPTFVDQNDANLNLDIRKRLLDALLRFERNPAFASKIRTDVIREAWDAFQEAFRETVTDVLETGFGTGLVPVMLEKYSALLRTVSRETEACTDLREEALSLLLSIGVFSFIDGRTSQAVVTPWNPLRMGALHRDFVTRAGLIRAMLENPGDAPVDGEAFAGLLRRQAERFEPCVAVAPAEILESDAHCLFRTVLAPIEHVSGYSLLSHVTGEDCRDDGALPGAVEELSRTAADYLGLAPLATDCLRVWLPDAVDKDFPLAVMTNLAKTLPETKRITLTAGDQDDRPETLDRLFSGLLDASTGMPAMTEASLTTNGAGSRLGMCVLMSDTPPDVQDPLSLGVRPWDLAFLDRFFTRNAVIDWFELPRLKDDAGTCSIRAALQDDSRRVMPTNEEHASLTLLCPTAVTDAGHAWLDAVRQASTGRTADRGETFFYPAVRIDTKDHGVWKELQRVHDRAHWVVTSNSLIDRRQLLQDDIDVVRYRRNAQTGRTCIVSCRMQKDILSGRISACIEDISTRFSEPECGGKTVRDILNAAFSISGHIAMRSARCENAAQAQEITGLALSHWLNLATADGLCRRSGETVLLATSILIDDHVSVLRNDGMLADLLLLVPALRRDEAAGSERLVLHLIISEAKYRSISNLSVTRKHSANQAAATARLLLEALAGGIDAPMRPAWHAFLADLVMGVNLRDIRDRSIDTNGLVRLAQQVRSGDFELTVNAASHVFVHDGEGVLERCEIEHPGCTIEQLVFGREQIARLLDLELDGSLSLDGIDRIMASSRKDAGTPCFRSARPTPAWRRADGLSLEFLEAGPVGKPSSALADVSPDDPGRTGGSARKTLPENASTPAAVPAGIPASAPASPALPVPGDANAAPPEGRTATDIPEHAVFAPDFEKIVRERGRAFGYSPERTTWAEDVTARLRTFLVGEGIPAVVISHSVTPNGCLIRFRGDRGLTTKVIEGHRDTLLSTLCINVLFAAPAPGEFRMLVNDGTGTRESVSMWCVWNRQTVTRRSGLNLSFVIGLKETDGNLLELDPTRADPHTLIAGDTGSGKTALVQELILDMAATNPSSLLRILLIDPKKGVDYRPLFRLPHMIDPPVTRTECIAGTVETLISEMERRYALFEETGVNKLTNYNARVAPEKRLPALFVIHDEVAFCMQDEDYRKNVPQLLTKLATKSRAAGIFLILIAQRPDKSVIPPQIRDNLGNRLILKMPEATCEFALGERGAERLLGKGHMVTKINGAKEYSQVPFLSDRNEDLAEVAEAISTADASWRVPSAGTAALEALLPDAEARPAKADAGS